jgi:hypothetical protein
MDALQSEAAEVLGLNDEPKFGELEEEQPYG